MASQEEGIRFEQRMEKARNVMAFGPDEGGEAEGAAPGEVTSKVDVRLKQAAPSTFAGRRPKKSRSQEGEEVGPRARDDPSSSLKSPAQRRQGPTPRTVQGTGVSALFDFVTEGKYTANVIPEPARPRRRGSAGYELK
ncbi:MAG: hypothetical protein JRM74_05665 [Nitrososphaerota archaeon]|nr:hypothetical protein [Nitrososphaerota archaeon]